MDRSQFTQAGRSTAVLAALGNKPAFAQAGLPLEPVKIFFGFPAGSSGDMVARIGARSCHLNKAGFPEPTVDEWFAFYAPAGTPAPVVNAASVAINVALKDKRVIDSLALVGLIAQGSTPAELGASQKQPFDRWGPLIKRIGFTAES